MLMLISHWLPTVQFTAFLLLVLQLYMCTAQIMIVC